MKIRKMTCFLDILARAVLFLFGLAILGYVFVVPVIHDGWKGLWLPGMVLAVWWALYRVLTDEYPVNR
jgi:hypothetical protein